jgi:hypothetical protein
MLFLNTRISWKDLVKVTLLGSFFLHSTLLEAKEEESSPPSSPLTTIADSGEKNKPLISSEVKEQPSTILSPSLKVASDKTTEKAELLSNQTEDEPARLSFNAFGTLSAVHSSEKNADFSPGSILKPNGAGYTDNWSVVTDSLLAGQATARLTPNTTAVLQLIMDQHYDKRYYPKTELAHIKYQFTPNFFMRLGREAVPGSFILTDTRKIGYSYPWARPPLDVYNLVPITRNDGIDGSYTFNTGSIIHALRFYYGFSFTDLVGIGVSGGKQLGASINSNYGALNTNISYQQGFVTANKSIEFFNLFRSFGPQGDEIADKYALNRKVFTIMSAGMNYDPHSWFLAGEYCYLNSKSSLGNRYAWYLSSGYHFGKITPFASYSRVRSDNLSDPGLDLSNVPAPATGFAAGINAGLNAILSGKPADNTISVGARWDFMKNMDLKIQFDHTHIAAGSTGGLTNTQSNFQLGGHLNLFTVMVDFVY